MRLVSTCILLSVCLCFAPVAEAGVFDLFSPSPATGKVPSGNASNDKLLRMNAREQATTLSRATNNSCMAKNQFYMGTEWQGANEGVSFWSFNCANNAASFMVAVSPDATGSTRVFSCNLMRGNPWKCFEKLKDVR